MSSDSVGQLHLRLREELDRLGLKLAEASRAAGESSAQRLKDVVSGRVRCPADLVERLAPTGINVLYVITGQENVATSRHLPPDEQLLLEAYRGLTAPARKALLAELLTAGTQKKASRPKPTEETASVKVRGFGNRTAGRDYHEKE